MKKTLISLLLVVAMLFATAVPAFAEVKGKLSATATPSGDGTSFTVNLFVKENSGFISLKVEAKYDSKVLKLKSAKNGEVFEDILVTSETTAVNPYQIIWMEATAEDNIKTNGLLASYTFEVLNTAPVGNAEITFEVVDVVDVSGDTKRNFNTCTFKVNVNGNQSSNPQTPSGGNTSNTSKNEVSDNEILDLQKPTANPDSTKPDSANPDSNQTVSDESPSNDDNNESTDNEAKEDLTTNSDETNENNGVVTTVIVIAAVLVLAAGATAVALYLKKKRANK